MTTDIRFLNAVDGNSYGLDKVYTLTATFQNLFFMSAPKISGAMWFLVVLFLTEVCYVILDYICKKIVKKHYLAMNLSMLLI